MTPAEVAGLGGCDVLPLRFVAEGEEGLRDEVARRAQFAADCGDEDDRAVHGSGLHVRTPITREAEF